MKQGLRRVVCHKDVRAVKDSAIVLRAERVETLEAEPTALLGPARQKTRRTSQRRANGRCVFLVDESRENPANRFVESLTTELAIICCLCFHVQVNPTW